MTRLGALSSTPMRLGIGLVTLFGSVSLLSLGGAFWVTRNGLDEAMRSDLQQALAGFTAIPDIDGLRDMITAQISATDPERRRIAFTDASLQTTGNLSEPVVWEGWRVLSLDDKATEGDGTYLALSAPVLGGHVMIAQSRNQISDLTETFTNIVLFSLLPTFAIALGGAYVLAARTARRVDRISGTLDQLTRGDLTARVPLAGGAKDDLALIGTAVNQMAASQEASVSALRQVSADIAHDLKTPIQRVAVLIERAGEAGGLNNATAALLDEARQETDRIVTTFQSLLTIAQVEGGSPRAHFGPVDLSGLVATFADLYAPAAEDSGHHLGVVEPRGGRAMISGDRALLGRMVANLIENALRHTPAGTTVSIGVARDAGRITLTVADTGPGIPAADRQAVLRRLHRLEQSRSTPGNGLGLSLVDAVAKLHDAELRLSDNAPGLAVSVSFSQQQPVANA